VLAGFETSLDTRVAYSIPPPHHQWNRDPEDDPKDEAKHYCYSQDDAIAPLMLVPRMCRKHGPLRWVRQRWGAVSPSPLRVDIPLRHRGGFWIVYLYVVGAVCVQGSLWCECSLPGRSFAVEVRNGSPYTADAARGHYDERATTYIFLGESVPYYMSYHQFMEGSQP